MHIDHGVLNHYKKLADEAKVDYGTIGRMSEEQIHSLQQFPPTPKPSELHIPVYCCPVNHNILSPTS